MVLNPKRNYIIRKDYNLDPYHNELLNELIDTGEFRYEVDVIKTAIVNLYNEYKAKGKLKPKLEKLEDRLTSEELEFTKKAKADEVEPEAHKVKKKEKR